MCCGQEREETLDCPLECEYLREARNFEKPRRSEQSEAPFAEVKLSDSLLDRNAPLIDFVAASLLAGALNSPSPILDADVRECLEALARTYKSLESGILYESVPSNLLAAELYHEVHAQIRQARERMRQRSGITTVRDADVFAVLVFLARLAADYDNGRRRGRAFIDFLRSYFLERQAGSETQAPASPPSPLIRLP